MIIVDGMMLARRCHAKMDHLATSDGRKTGMEYGFLKVIESVKRKLLDDVVVIAWDSRRSIRKAIDPEYKANRVGSLEPSFWQRLDKLKSVVTAVYRSYWLDGYEADDIMACIALQADRSYVYTNDKDLLQVVSDRVTQVTSHESQLWAWDPESVFETYGVMPSEFALYKSFVGDPGDNIPGVKRVRKTIIAEKVRSRTLFEPDGYTDKELDAVLAFGVERYLKNYELVRLRCLLTPEELPRAGMDEFSAFLNELQIRSLSYEF